MDPDPRTIEQWSGIGDVVGWCKMKGDVSEAQSVAGSLLKLVGAEPGTPVRMLGIITETDWNAIIAEWRPEDRAPSPIEKSQAALVGRASRIATGTTLSQEQQAKADEEANARKIKELELQVQIAQANSPPSNVQQQTQQASPTTSRKKVKMSAVVDQINEQEVEALTEDDINTCYKNYTKIFQDLPPEGEECTVEQLTALNELLKSGCPPYTDFALWGPYGLRMLRKVKLSGMHIAEGGELRHIELPGPPNFAMWEKCYRVLRTGLIMHDAVSVSNLDSYCAHFKRYFERYGPRVFLIQYQAEVRTRQEKMIVWKRQGAEEHRLHPTTSTYNPDKPWDWVWRRAVQDHYWWRCELEEPCLLVVARTTSVESMVDGDVAIQEPPLKKGKRNADDNHHHTTSIGNESPFGYDSLTNTQTPRHHNISNGTFTTNRRGVKLCPDFNAGNCTQVKGSQKRCAKNSSLVHQCDKCLSTDHPGSQCNKTPSTQGPSQHMWAPSGKGKSKGKGKGKKGGKNRWYYG